MYICQQCGKEVYEKFASGRFCCRSCSNKYTVLHQSPEAKARKVEAGKKNLGIRKDSNGNIVSRKGNPGRKWSDEEKKAHSEKMKKIMSNPDVRSKISESLNRNPVKVSDETRKKISEKVKLSHIEGRNPGWMSRNVHSYAENFWKTVLDNNGISYTQEYKVTKKSIGIEGYGCYFLDFLLDGNVDLEIDGKQHADRVEHDRIRDKNLEAAGYKVYRIRFRNPVLSDIVKADIDKFLEWYSKFRDG